MKNLLLLFVLILSSCSTNLVKNDLEIYDERFPEISGKRGENLKRLFDNRIITFSFYNFF